ncbi:hypothetical protein L1987_70457 [Smallanthus sonchifolius]|uniref:Uncharacterized protein n=1 Tax=Smallanthus sonchifolius TaxID=185202 RepID=A0ACB9AQC7_9ASTR|nr:hypothetical protein L1987_70457 [Smallanthus sonchifolius]
MFEILCGKRAVDSSIDEEHWGLAIWAQVSIKEGRLKQIVDTNIRGSISPKCLKVFAQLAKRCLHKHPKQRPTMAEVVVSLESILALQEKASNALQPTSMEFSAKKASKVKFLSNDENSGGRSLNSLELYFDTIGGEDQTLRRFDLDTLIVATKNFSEANKISEQSSDSLYKGKLQNGQGIAVAEPSYGTRHKEYSMNEAFILVKLEHENVTKLLGYCIEGTRLFLVYDFALHAILDRLIFDPECTLLNWDNRYRIIIGVARALLYLHRDAPVRVIHCDVKPGSILLDESLNPVLSSFWSARCLAINETNCRVPRICGTWGYMARECMLNEDISTKADVYSLGVMVLEFITGRRAITRMSLYNGKNRSERTLPYVIDPRIDVDSSSMTRFIEIGLLCAQEDAEDRPTMEEVVSMLLDSSSPILPMAKTQEMIEYSNSTSAIVDDYDTSAVVAFTSELFPR